MRKTLSKVVLLTYLVSTFFFYNFMVVEDVAIPGFEDLSMTATDLGVMCISTAYPSMGLKLADSRDNDGEFSGGKMETLENNHDKDKEDSKDVVISSEEPKVLIVHTHATESYLPASGGNFHTRDEENTVRDVGNVLQRTLEAKGIGVVHDKTLHDYPSYNDSYDRSYDTTETLLAKYPTIECVIDLHRDAVSSTEPSPTVSIGGKTCARYSYVIGTGASTYSQNKAFITKLNDVASKKYEGFTGAVIERGYRYNQDLSSQYLLLEIGFNRNQIEDCRNTATVVGNILAEVLR